MLIIKTLFGAVVLYDEEFAIYTRDYPADINGDELDKDDSRIESLKYYEYGDLYIETSCKKYVFKKIYSAYAVAADLINKISEPKNETDPVVIDIGTLGGRGEDRYDAFQLEVLSK